MKQAEGHDKNTEKTRGLKIQSNPYEWISLVEDNGYLHEFGPEPMEGKVSVNHDNFTTIVSIHGGQKATKGHKCVALLDSGSPCSFVTQAAINEMLQKGAASADMIAVNDKPRKWGGFSESEEALQTNSTAGLSVQFYNSKEQTAYMQLYCHIVTPTALQYDLLLGRDSFLKFQNHTYATLPNETGKPSVGILDLRKKTKAVALIQAEDKENDFHLRYAGKEKSNSKKMQKHQSLRAATDTSSGSERGRLDNR